MTDLMYPAELPWVETEPGVHKVQIGQLGLLIVRKIGVVHTVVIFGKELQARSITLTEAKERAELAARKWIAQAGAIMWTREEPKKPELRRSAARPGGVSKKG